MKKVNIFGINYAVTDYTGAVSYVFDKISLKEPCSVFALPVHGVVEFQKDKMFQKAVCNADLVVADGQPIKWAMNFFYKASLTDRVYGPTLMQKILVRANEEHLRVFLYGGKSKETLEKLNAYISKNFPDVIVCGSYREKLISDDSLSIESLNKAKPDIVFVGLGCPNQEKWIYKKCVPEVRAVFFGVGAAFSFYAGELTMAPKWMQNNGLEWLFRLYCEPRRLFRRYFSTNTYFVFLVIKKILRI